MTVAEALRETGRRLEAVGGTGRLDAALLLEHVTGATRESFITDDARALTAGRASGVCAARSSAG